MACVLRVVMLKLDKVEFIEELGGVYLAMIMISKAGCACSTLMIMPMHIHTFIIIYYQVVLQHLT